MAGQKVGRCTSYDAAACMLIPASVPTRHDGNDVEGGEPMMIMLRCSEFAVILAIEASVKINLTSARVVIVVRHKDLLLG